MAGYSGIPLAKKLGMSAASRVLVVDAPNGYRALLKGLPDAVEFVATPSSTIEVAHTFFTKKSPMTKTLGMLRRKLPDSAVVWVSWPKKSSRVATDITEDTVREVALPLGFVDVKVCAIDDIWSALKLVVRKELRRKTMRKSQLGVVCLMLIGAQAAGDAHFKLLEPASWLVASDRGDPQKAAPCGGDAKDKGTPSNIVTKAVGGQKVHIKVLETVYHPGHYRVALAVNSRDELPADPVTTTRETEKGPRSVWAVIQSPPQKPVLADGLFPHYTKPSGPLTWETDIELPNISCKKCTLQIVQWMAEHGYNNPGGYTYHHCADFEITADPSKPLETGWGPAQSKAN